MWVESKFHNYKTWRVTDTSATKQLDTFESVDSPGSSGSPRSEARAGDQDHHLIHHPGDFYEDDIYVETMEGEREAGSDQRETQSSNLRRRIKTVARISQEFSNNVAGISSHVEKALHLLFWTDPRLSTIFVAACLSAALLLVVIPPNYVALLGGCYLMRPPQFRNSKNGVLTNLWSRLPDNSDTF